MFDQQINGSINPCCEILYNGVPFERGLNNAARINVGIDIVNTLSDFFVFKGPIFVDNAESINDIADTPAQVIGLYVSTDEKLIIKDKNNMEVTA